VYTESATVAVEANGHSAANGHSSAAGPAADDGEHHRRPELPAAEPRRKAAGDQNRPA